MATEIKMPQLSDTMDAGKILAWHKQEGDLIERGDILAEVETDKANLEIESFHPGTLLKIVVPVGAEAPVGEIIAIVGEAGEATNINIKSEPASTAPEVHATEATSPTEQHETSIQPGVNSNAPSEENERIKASPLARKLAAQQNLELKGIRGSGPGGRIISKDIQTALNVATAQPQADATTVEPSTLQSVESGTGSPSTGPTPGRLKPLSRMRASIAKRMQQSMQEAPHFYVTVSIRMDNVLELRQTLQQRGEYQGLSVNHFVLKAAAYALAHEPGVNSAFRNNQVFVPAEINIGIVTAVEDGLLIPVIHRVDQLTLPDLVFEARTAIERARAGRPNSADLSGGTFTISNLGMFGVESFTAVINPGQGGILAVGTASETPMVLKGQVIPATVMKATLAVDHRIIDGVTAGIWLSYFRSALEQPALLSL